jgi:superfamily II DNA or RNA helicase
MATGLLDKPALGPCRVQLRPYQTEAIDAVRARYVAGDRSTLLVLPTGTGKTMVFGSVARRVIEKGGRALVLAHREELVSQAVNKLDQVGVEAGVEMASQYARSVFEPDTVVATVQTMQGKRLATWPRDYFKLLIIDESHHATAESYQRICDHFRCRILGVTATADRADGEDLGRVFQSVAYEMSLWEAMTAPPPGPYLCRLRFVQCDLQVDLRDLRPRRDDYSDSDLEERIVPLAQTIANAVRQEFGGRRTLIFTPGVRSAQGIATALQSLGLSFDWSSGDDPGRAVKVEKYTRGELQGLANCALFTEGFDVPETAAVVLCRPTKSRSLYAQQVGRGTRLAKDKPDCLVIDFDYLTAKHDLVKAVDLFDTTRTDSEVLEIAQKAVEATKGLDLLEAVRAAEKTHRERQVLRVRAAEKELRYRRVCFDPLTVFDTLGVPWRGNKDAVTNRATDAQVAALTNCGIEDAPNLSKTRASTLLDYIQHRRKEGLATVKQTAWCIAKGCDPAEARKMTFEEASQFLDGVFRKRA